MSTNAGTAAPAVEAVEPTGATTPPDAQPNEAKPAQKAEPQKGKSPWETELEQRGLNDPKFAEYMREKQGYVTQVEQAAATYSKLFGEGDEGVEAATIASNILKGLDTNPIETLNEIVRLLELDPVELFGDPTEYDEGDDYNPEYDDGEDYEEEPDPYRSWVEQKMQAEQEAQADQAYDNIIAQIEKQHGGFNASVFHNYVLAYGGDITQAYEQYRQDFPPQVRASAPPVIGGPTGANPPQPEKQYSGFGDAIDDFMSDLKASRRR